MRSLDQVTAWKCLGLRYLVCVWISLRRRKTSIHFSSQTTNEPLFFFLEIFRKNAIFSTTQDARPSARSSTGTHAAWPVHDACRSWLVPTPPKSDRG